MNGNGWKGWALAILTAFILGGGLSSLVAKANVDALEMKHDKEIEQIELRSEKDYDIIMEMSNRLVRIETKLDTLMR